MKKILSLCLALVAMATALALGMPEQNAFGASACMTMPNTTNCDKKDPIDTGCYLDATDLTVASGSGVTIQLRYSPKCKSAWARSSTGLPASIKACVERKPLTTNSPQCWTDFSTDAFSNMLYLGRNTYQGRAGGAAPSTATLTYTGWKLGT
jgi:Protein of unknown function (DUF2690)